MVDEGWWDEMMMGVFLFCFFLMMEKTIRNNNNNNNNGSPLTFQNAIEMLHDLQACFSIELKELFRCFLLLPFLRWLLSTLAKRLAMDFHCMAVVQNSFPISNVRKSQKQC